MATAGIATNFSQVTRANLSIATVATDVATAALVPAGWYYVVVTTQGASLSGGVAAVLEEVWLPGSYGPFYVDLSIAGVAGVGDGKLHAIGVGVGPGRVDLVPCTAT